MPGLPGLCGSLRRRGRGAGSRPSRGGASSDAPSADLLLCSGAAAAAPPTGRLRHAYCGSLAFVTATQMKRQPRINAAAPWQQRRGRRTRRLVSRDCRSAGASQDRADSPSRKRRADCCSGCRRRSQRCPPSQERYHHAGVLLLLENGGVTRQRRCSYPGKAPPSERPAASRRPPFVRCTQFGGPRRSRPRGCGGSRNREKAGYGPRLSAPPTLDKAPSLEIGDRQARHHSEPGDSAAGVTESRRDGLGPWWGPDLWSGMRG
jgi:hypothetical protein